MEFFTLIIEYLFVFIGSFTCVVILGELAIFYYKYKKKKNGKVHKNSNIL